MKLLSRNIKCPRCGSQVRIPVFWTLGIEGIFRCPSCKLPFKTGYRMGAALFAISLALSLACAQLLIYIFSSYSLPLFVLAAIPLWIIFGFILRKTYMMRHIQRSLKKRS